METSGTNFLCFSESFVNYLVFQRASRSRVPQQMSSLSFQQFLFSAYGPVHTSLWALIKVKATFCSNHCSKGGEDHTVWKPAGKAISSEWFTMQLLKTWDLFSLASRAGFAVRLDVVLSSGAQGSAGRAKVLIAVEICQHGAANDMIPLQALLLALCLPGITSPSSEDAVKFPWYTLAYTEGLAPEAGWHPKSLKTLNSTSWPLLGSQNPLLLCYRTSAVLGKMFHHMDETTSPCAVLASSIKLKIQSYGALLSFHLFAMNKWVCLFWPK